jgi:hypothetical protein
MMGGFGRAAIDADMPLRQQPLNGPARDAGKLRPQKSVQPLQRKRLPDGDLAGRFHGLQFNVERANSHVPETDTEENEGNEEHFPSLSKCNSELRSPSRYIRLTNSMYQTD